MISMHVVMQLKSWGLIDDSGKSTIGISVSLKQVLMKFLIILSSYMNILNSFLVSFSSISKVANA